MLSSLVPSINIEAVCEHQHKLYDLFVVVGVDERGAVSEIDRKVLFHTKAIAFVF